MGSKTSVKFKILFHFIKGKISLTSMETILIIVGELDIWKDQLNQLKGEKMQKDKKVRQLRFIQPL